MEFSPLANIVSSLTSLHEIQHQALLQLPKTRRSTYRTHSVPRQQISRCSRAWTIRQSIPAAATPPPWQIWDCRLGMYENSVEAWGWHSAHWVTGHLSLLTGKTGTTCGSAAAGCLLYMLECTNLKQAIWSSWQSGTEDQ
ncbi:uncharacterized protein LOC113068006 [Tachysurus ichikawai]